MEDKENVMRIAMKRKSGVIYDNIIPSKRSTFYLNGSFSENETSFASDNSMICDSPDLQYTNPNESCLTNPLKTCLSLNPSAHTPTDQIVPLKDFFKLPKPEFVKSAESAKSEESVKESPLDVSLTDSSCSTPSSANDSFSKLKKFSRAKTYDNPQMGVFDTPETPSDLNDIDLENLDESPSFECLSSNKISTMYRNMSLPLKNALVSPIFYDQQTQSRPNMTQLKINRTSSRAIPTSDLQFIGEKESKIEELSADSLSKIVQNDCTSDSYACHIIDCRYPYEFDGGHIDGAVNLYTPYQMLNYIFLANYDMAELRKPVQDPEEALKEVITAILNIDKPPSTWKQSAFIFHCEFSSIRGPQMAQSLRNIDRLANMDRYPYLHFPRVYVLTKGYKEFFSKYKDLCKPNKYVTMEITRPPMEEGDRMAGESDDGEENTPLDEETARARVRTYNLCKRESHDQMRAFSKLVNSQNVVLRVDGDRDN